MDCVAFVGANSFAPSLLLMRMNSHLQIRQLRFLGLFRSQRCRSRIEMASCARRELALQAAHSLACECRSGLQTARRCCLFNALHPAPVPDADSIPAQSQSTNKNDTARVSLMWELAILASQRACMRVVVRRLAAVLLEFPTHPASVPDADSIPDVTLSKQKAQP